MSTFSIINAVNVTCEFTSMKIVKTHFEIFVLLFYFFHILSLYFYFETLYPCIFIFI